MRGVRLTPRAVRAAVTALPALPGGAAASVRADPAGALTRAPVVWEWQGARVHRYAQRRPRGRPVLVVYAQVNRAWLVDLAPGHSLVQTLRGTGREVYVLDWGWPGPAQADLALDDYVLTGLEGALRAVCAHARIRSAHVLGVCQGGALALAHAALVPARVRSLTTLMTPVDGQAPAPLHAALGALADALVQRPGANLPGTVLAGLFELMDGLRRPPPGGPGTVRSRRLGALLARWLADTPDLPGRAGAQFIHAWYRDNALIRETLELDGRAVRLGALRMPVFNAYARSDHLVPAAASAALARVADHAPYRELVWPGGHLSLCVSPPALAALRDALGGFLRAAD